MCHLASKGIADAEQVVHGRSGASAWVSGPPPFHGRCAEALRPAWASWMPSLTLGIQARAQSTTGFSAVSFSSLYRPAQPWVMRPSRSTCVASRQSRPAPDIAIMP